MPQIESLDNPEMMYVVNELMKRCLSYHSNEDGGTRCLIEPAPFAAVMTRIYEMPGVNLNAIDCGNAMAPSQPTDVVRLHLRRELSVS